MFGYIRPLQEELKIRDYDAYRAAYCGLCRTLGKRYGLSARFFVNYDMTFLYFVLACVKQSEKTVKCFCPANPLCRKNGYAGNDILEFVADADVLLCRHKLLDNIADEGFFKGLPYRMAAAVTGGAARKAAKRLPALEALLCEQLARLDKLEQEHCASIDATADTFASILKGCALFYTCEELRRPLEQVLYHVGRFLYLIDAWDDLKKDLASDDYNPLRYRFKTQDGSLSQEDREYLFTLLDGSVSLAGAAYELLPKCSGQGVLENIIYVGMPYVLKLVEQGTFHERKKMRAR